MANDIHITRRPAKTRSHGTPELEADATDQAPPPYQVRDVDMIFLEGTLAPRYARALLPHGIEQAPTHACMIACYVAPRGWGLTPFTSTYARLAIAGHDSPDGSEGLFKVAETASGRAGEILHQRYNVLCSVADTSIVVTAGRMDAVGDIGEGGRVEIGIRLGSHLSPDVTAGAHTELGLSTSGLVTWTTAYSCALQVAELDQIQWSIPAGHRLQGLRHFRPTTAYRLFDKSFSIGPPTRRADSGGVWEPQSSLIDLVERLQLKVVVFERGGNLAFISEAARDALGDLVEAWTGDGACRQFGSLGGTSFFLPSPLVTQTKLIERSDGTHLAMRLVPVAPSLWGRHAFLGLISDPNGGGSRLQPESVLRLLGLTPAEARLARMMAKGISRPAAAVQLGVSENTVRSASKSIYSKLRISSRAELAAFVAGMGEI